MGAAKRRRPRGHIRELPSGSFQVIAYAGTDPLTKKPRYIRETLKTYGTAEVALTRLQGQVDQNRHPKTDITLGQAISRWLEIAKLEDTTRDRYEDLVRMYIGPVLGDLPAGKLDAELLESFYARLQRCRDLCDGGQEETSGSSARKQPEGSVKRRWRGNGATSAYGHLYKNRVVGRRRSVEEHVHG